MNGIMVYDNGGKTADRYTVLFPVHDSTGHHSYSMSDNAASANGVCMYTGFTFETGRYGRRIMLGECPKEVLVQIINLLSEKNWR